PADSDRVSRDLPASARRMGPGVVSRGGDYRADLHGGAGARGVGPGRPLSRHTRYSGESPDVLVLRDADHLPVVSAGPRALQAAVQPESVHTSRRVVPGDPVFQWADRALEVAARARRRLGQLVPGRVLAVRSAARFVCRGCMKYATETQRKIATETQRHRDQCFSV